MASALGRPSGCPAASVAENAGSWVRSEEHTSELQSQSNLVCRLLLEKKKKKNNYNLIHLKTKLKQNIHMSNSTPNLRTPSKDQHVVPKYISLATTQSIYQSCTTSFAH